jgi:glycosyltransferase involved in cell wall biosynthesis
MSLKPPASLSPPRISVIVPVFNGAPYLAETLESIRRQTLPVAEVIVVDDGSTDESTEIAATLNRGLEEATGNLIAFLDQDDRWLPQKSLLQVTALRENLALDFVFGHVRRFRSAPAGATEGESTIDILRGVSKQCMMIKKPSFDQVGFFSNEGRYDFLDWYSRALEAGLQGEILPEVVAERRIHAANFGVQNPEEQRRGYLSTLKATLDRQRAAKVAASAPATSLERTA